MNSALAGPRGRTESDQFDHKKISRGLAWMMERASQRSDNEQLPVIVQFKQDYYGRHGIPSRLLRARGLDLVNGYAGYMDVKSIQDLARLPWIDQITVDAKIRSSNGSNLLEDHFNNGFAGNDGNVAWVGDWVESGESDGTGSGLVRIKHDYYYCASGKCIRLGDYEQRYGGPWSLTRQADLTDATSATLNYTYSIKSSGNEGFLKTQVRNANGNWQTLVTYAIVSGGDDDDDEGGQNIRRESASFDISNYASSNTAIRFLLTREDSSNSNSNEVEGYFYIDDIQIQYDGPSHTVNYSYYKNPFIQSIGIEQNFSGYNGTSNQIDYNGTGVGVAVFDSGVANHFEVDTSTVIDFTSGSAIIGPAGNDEYGHGTHVSGIISGNGLMSNGFHSGVAPDADLLHVKVLDGTGVGSTSNLIAAINWVIQNKNTYNIRVANLSLGHPALESAETDPLCQAVRSMVDAGIVAVVSAGNWGKTDEFPELWGAVNSPGTEPSAITVGAINTMGTVNPQG